MPLLPTSQISQAVGTRGEIQVSLVDGSISSYCATMVGIAAVNGDIFEIQGISNGVVRITRIDIALQAASAAAATVALQRRSAASTGGGKSGTINTKNDSGNPSSSSAPSFYTSTPVPGPPVGTPRTVPILITATNALPDRLGVDLSVGHRQALALRGTSDFFTIALAGTLAGATCTINVEWTESPT